ncbi:MAG TPA: cache domain-containing protein [Desulfosporosinus sp.]|nr:cache domain-containing protein [Desulfosporosinus sp.]
MINKKILVVGTIMVLMVSLAGCAKKPVAPVTPPASTAVLPEDHPAETPAAAEDKVGQAAAETKINDVLNKNYPGDWKVSGTNLSKGTYTENGKYKMVDDVLNLFPNTMGVSIFVGEERISSTVKQGTERVLAGYPTPATVGEVMKSGTTTSNLSSGYLKVYVPFKDSTDQTVAVMTVSIPKE